MDAIESTHNGNGQHEPISILGYLLVRINKNVSSKIIIWVCSALMIFKTFYRLYSIFDPTISLYDDNIVKYEKIYNQLYALSLGLILLNFYMDYSMYIKYLNAYKRIVKNGFDIDSTEYVEKQLKINRLFIKLAFICELAITGYNNYLNYYRKLGFRREMIFLSVTACITQCSSLIFVQFIIECCIYCQSSFIPLNNSLDIIIRQNERSIDINRIARLVRLSYDETTDSIRCMDKFLTFVLFAFYSYYIGHCIFAFGIILSYASSFYFLSFAVLRFLVDAFYLFWVTYHLVRVNQLSIQMFDKVYRLSFSLDSSHTIATMNEVRLESSVHSFL